MSNANNAAKNQEQARKAFAEAHRSLWAAVKKTGAQPYNLLHHPKRGDLIDACGQALADLKASAEAFEGKPDNKTANATNTAGQKTPATNTTPAPQTQAATATKKPS